MKILEYAAMDAEITRKIYMTFYKRKTFWQRIMNNDFLLTILAASGAFIACTIFILLLLYLMFF